MLQLLISAFVSISAFAKDAPCAILMENGVGDLFQESPGHVELDQAQQWLFDHGHPNASEQESLGLYRQWQRWNTINDRQRDHTLALELKLISPVAGDALFLWEGRPKLNELSKQNLKRMLLQLKIRHPEVSDLSKFEKQSATASQSLRIAYSVPLPKRSMSGVTPPIASPRELLKSQLQPLQPDYYSTLVNGSPSAAFSVRLSSGGAAIPAGMYLRPDVAQSQGFVMPYFDNVETLLAFFSVWDIEALDQLLKDNRMSFPFTVRTGRQMIEYFQKNPIDIDQVFPPQAPEKMNALRVKLRDYVLSEEDARTFIREAFQLYTLSLAHNKQTDFTRLTSELYGKIGPGDQIFRKFFEFIDFPGLTLRVPVAVKASDYQIVREAPADLGVRSTPLNSLDPLKRRVDHNSKP